MLNDGPNCSRFTRLTFAWVPSVLQSAAANLATRIPLARRRPASRLAHNKSPGWRRKPELATEGSRRVVVVVLLLVNGRPVAARASTDQRLTGRCWRVTRNAFLPSRFQARVVAFVVALTAVWPSHAYPKFCQFSGPSFTFVLVVCLRCQRRQGLV